MPTIATTSLHSVEWNETTILQLGISFLNQKNEQIKSYKDLWDASINSPRQQNECYENSAPEKARRKFASIAKQSKKEIKQLVDSLIFHEFDKQPSPMQINQLAKITFVAIHCLKYFKSVVDAASEKTLSDKLMTFQQKKAYSYKINPVLDKVATYATSFGLVALATAGYSIYAKSPIGLLTTSIATIAGLIKLSEINFKRGIIATVVHELNNSDRNHLSWNLVFGNEPTAIKVGILKNKFENSLLENTGAVDYIHQPDEKIIHGGLEPSRYEYSAPNISGSGTIYPEFLEKLKNYQPL